MEKILLASCSFVEGKEGYFNSLCFIKTSVCHTFWMDVLPTHKFVTSCIGDLENTGSVSYEALPNVDTFHYTP